MTQSRFSGVLRVLLPLALTCLLVWGLWQSVVWGVFNAHWSPDAKACAALQGQGACWGVVAEKWPLLLWGRYPQAFLPRAYVATGLALGALLLCMWRPSILRSRHVYWLWVAVYLAASSLVRGGVLGLESVPAQQLGGLPLTLLVAIGGAVVAWPLAIGLSLARASGSQGLSRIAAISIECIRGVPLVAVLFVAAFVWPLLFPDSAGGDKLLRTTLALGFFLAAYQAEVLRGGLQVLSTHQVDSAKALGFGWYGLHRHIVMPQVIKVSMPALTNTWISTLKDSSLITVVSLYELTGGLSIAVGGDALWRPYYLEAYLFIGVVYGVLNLCIGRMGNRLQRS